MARTRRRLEAAEAEAAAAAAAESREAPPAPPPADPPLADPPGESSRPSRPRRSGGRRPKVDAEAKGIEEALRASWRGVAIVIGRMSGSPLSPEEVDALVASSLPCAIKYGGIPPELTLVFGCTGVLAPHAVMAAMNIRRHMAEQRASEQQARNGTSAPPAAQQPAQPAQQLAAQ